MKQFCGLILFSIFALDYTKFFRDAVSRLRSRNEELECEVKDLTNKFEQLQEDQSDVVAHLKRELEGKIEEARELSERLQALEELRKTEQTECKKKENAMELEYRTMESNLSAEVKLAGNVSVTRRANVRI